MYLKFDYFSTTTDKLWIHKCNPENYGLFLSEVQHYIYQMEEDRQHWEEKRKKLDEWGPLLQLFVSFFAVFICSIICVISYEIFNENSSICTILSTIFILLLIGYEFYIWKKLTIWNMYNRWMERKYKKRTQYNPVIEKLLDDANLMKLSRWIGVSSYKRTTMSPNMV